MPPSKFEANPTLRVRVKRSSFSLFPLASSCSNADFRAYAIGFPKYGHIYILSLFLLFFVKDKYVMNRLISIRK